MWRKIFNGMERRKYIRVPVELNVDFKLNREGDETSLHRGMARNISPEGICLSTDVFSKEEWGEIAQKKRHLHLCVYIPRGDKEEKLKADAEVATIDVEAEIVWQEHGKKDGKNKCLIGLHFTRIEKDGQEVIRSFIADNLIAKYRPA